MQTDDPTASSDGPGAGLPADLRLTQTQKEILEALCRPHADGNRYATPATNQEIASKVYLSVDAVKAHLRVLYRKFGVEPLPHNQKRARLVELVFEGGVLDLPTEEEPVAAPPPPSAEPAPPQNGHRDRRTLALMAIGLLVAAAIVILLATGALGGSDSDSPEPTPLGEYRTEVNRFCGFVVPFTPPPARQPVEDRANAYTSAFSTLGDRIGSVPPPAGDQPALDQFTAGLSSAAEINNEIALDPPTGRAAESDIANLTIASGNVQAGSLGFGLGSDCKTIADVIVQSALNVAPG
jgi:hypothetical protein